MTRDIINVQCPVVDVTQSVADVTVEKTVINTTNGINIKKAFKNKVTLRDVILPEGKDPADLPEEELLKAYLERKKII